MAVPAQAVAAHRLVLSAAEFTVLVGACGMMTPAGFGSRSLAAEQRAAVSAGLVERGVFVETDGDAYQPVESVAANVAVLTGPAVMVQVDVSAGERGLRAVFAVSGPLGASLFTVRDGAVELSLFPAVGLGVELIRAVPAPEDLGTVRSRVAAALGGGQDEARLVGRLRLAALESAAEDAGPAIAPIGSTDEDATLAEQINRHTTGLLSCLVTGRVGDEVAAGQVVWLATGSGWLGVRPDSNPDGTRMVVVAPVDRADLGTWVAPSVAAILEATR